MLVCIGSVWGRHSLSTQQIFVSVGLSYVQARCQHYLEDCLLERTDLELNQRKALGSLLTRTVC